MENAALIALSRQMTLRRELDIVANNIANADTSGFKVEGLIVEEEAVSHARNFGVYGAPSFVLDQGVGRDFSQGAIRQTGRPLDVALEGEGVFFRIGDPNGGPERYTRDGGFTSDGEGRLVTRDGRPVLDNGGAEIVLDPSQGEPTIAQDGTISQGGATVGQLGVVRFDVLSVLSKDGDGLYRNTSNEQPADATDAQVRQGMLEGSNVDTLVEITNLIQIQRAYESTARLIENLNDLSRRSVERLGRAS